MRYGNPGAAMKRGRILLDARGRRLVVAHRERLTERLVAYVDERVSAGALTVVEVF
jgi:hypothetical protein